eukprot:scaffold208956_cov35-Cyclotella_meneghiniana.AAC.1
MMKRGINTILWPYVAVSMYNELRKICVGCEGIVSGEKKETCKFVSDFLAKYTPGRPLSEVSIVAGDEFFNQEMIEYLGFVNAKYIKDHFHLFDSGLGKKFGVTGHNLLKNHLAIMIRAGTEEDFNKAATSAHTSILSQCSVDGALLKSLDDFIAEKETYATYCLEKRNRIQPAHEKRVKRAKNKPQKQPSIAYSGSNGLALLVNAKKVAKCSFCHGEGHNVSSSKCPRAALASISSETVLSAGSAGPGTVLRQRITGNMPISGTLKQNVPLYDRVDQKLLSANFIIHSSIDRMAFDVSFLESNGEVQNSSHLLVSGKVMNELITHTQMKKKYVFDQTMQTRRGGDHNCSVNSTTAENMPAANDDSVCESGSDDDDVVINDLRKDKHTA